MSDKYQSTFLAFANHEDEDRRFKRHQKLKRLIFVILFVFTALFMSATIVFVVR